MPLPLLPFLIKGAFVVGKVLLSKGAVAKGAAVVTKSAVAKYGAAKTTSVIVTGLVCTGGIAWTLENIERMGRAYELCSEGNYRGAADELTRIAISIKTVGTGDYAADVKKWLANGKPLDATFIQLITNGKALADEAAASAKFIK